MKLELFILTSFLICLISSNQVEKKNNHLHSTKCHYYESNKQLKCFSKANEVFCEAHADFSSKINHTRKYLIGTYANIGYYANSQMKTFFLCPKNKHGVNYTKEDFLNLYHSKKFESYGLRVDNDLCFQKIVKLLDESTELKTNKYKDLYTNFDIRLLGVLLTQKTAKNQTSNSYILNKLKYEIQKTKKDSKHLVKQNLKSKNKESDTSDSDQSSESESDSSEDEN